MAADDMGFGNGQAYGGGDLACAEATAREASRAALTSRVQRLEERHQSCVSPDSGSFHRQACSLHPGITCRTSGLRET